MPSVSGLRWARGPNAGRALAHSNVYDSYPKRGWTHPLHHILMIAVVVCRVGLSAVLKVVCKHGVPAVLLLWAVGERHWPVGLDFLQCWVVKWHQILFGARQQLLLLISIILGLITEEKSKWMLIDCNGLLPRHSGCPLNINKLGQSYDCPEG